MLKRKQNLAILIKREENFKVSQTPPVYLKVRSASESSKLSNHREKWNKWINRKNILMNKQ